jgi:general secretion pathway protein G
MAINLPILDSDTARALGEKHRMRHRALERIHKQYERSRQELEGAFVPSVLRNPTFYFGVMFVLALIGMLLFGAADRSVSRNRESRVQRAMRHVDVLAEALGRYRFHVGHYPSATQGLAALVRDPGEEQWDGPYISHLRGDPWGIPFVYEPREGANPLLLSSGPDGKPGTSDDIHPELERFDPGTEWTNGWVSAYKRLPGITVLQSDPQQKQ